MGIVIAAGIEMLLIGGAVAIALLLIVMIRTTQRYRMLDLEVQRLRKAHHDGTLDARSRLEDASKALEALEESVGPRIEAIEPHLADVGSRLDEVEERLGALVPALEAAGRRESEVQEVLDEAHGHLERAAETAREVGERFGTVEEEVRDLRTRLEEAERGLERMRAVTDERFETLDRDRSPETASVVHATTREATGASTGGEEDGDTDAGADRAPAPTRSAVDPKARAKREGRYAVRGMLLVLLAIALFALLAWLSARP
jgi:predicted  nucleic acid-binding Zn-ribbon protein